MEVLAILRTPVRPVHPVRPATPWGSDLGSRAAVERHMTVWILTNWKQEQHPETAISFLPASGCAIGEVSSRTLCVRDTSVPACGTSQATGIVSAQFTAEASIRMASRGAVLCFCFATLPLSSPSPPRNCTSQKMGQNFNTCFQLCFVRDLAKREHVLSSRITKKKKKF